MEPELPANMRQLGRLPSGFVIPWFVDRTLDPIDFRIVDMGKLAKAHKQKRCWLCGQTRGAYLAFVIGPMCSINRISAEPPCHLACARYAVHVCPFLSNPQMRRSPRPLPEERREPAGKMIDRNPGVSAIWITKSYQLVRAEIGNEGSLFRIGPPERIEWYCQGREATRTEVMRSIDSGYPLLLELAKRDGPEAIRELDKAFKAALPLLPTEAAA